MKMPLLIAAALMLAACSREYTPADTATGEQIYRAACMECHKPAANGSIYTLKTENASAAYIAAKVHSGSLLMPSFPNLKTDDLAKISTYALENSVVSGE